METLIEKMRRRKPETNSAVIYWLGQAGFAIQTNGGRLIAIDPFLSENMAGMPPSKNPSFKRLTPPPCEARELAPDLLLISHEHEDHFDTEAIGALTANAHTQTFANPPVVTRMHAMGIQKAAIAKQNETLDFGEFTLTPLDCDHGTSAPEALGFMFDFGFAKIYYAGDTSLTPERLTIPIEARPDIAILPINGAFGNLNSEEAAAYAAMLHCRALIPCHFWMFPMHHGDPQLLVEALPKHAPSCRLYLPRIGDGVETAELLRP